MKIISLIENTSGREDIKSEHGLSLYIDALGKKILFDMGQSDSFAENAERLGIDLSCVDFAILSHGHYDHGGGLSKFLKINEKAPVYTRKTAFLPHFNGEKYIGLDPSLSESERIRFTDGECIIAEGIFLSALDSAPDECSPLLSMRGGRLVADSFDHEQYLIIEENGRRVLISGCSHKGILPIIKKYKPSVMIGGFHFMNLPLEASLIERAEQLDKADCDYYTCHCTGLEQFEFLKNYIKHIKYLSAGDSVEI